MRGGVKIMNQTSNSLVGFDLDELSEDALIHEQVLLLSPEQCYCDVQVRTIFEEQKIDELAESLKNTWQQQAIVVYPADANDLYKIDKGERRWRAASKIDGFKLKAIVDPDAPHRDRQHRLLGQLTENISRVDLPIPDMAKALGQLIEIGLTQEEIAIKLGWITRSKKANINKVSRFLSVLKLPEEGIALISENIINDLITLELLRKLHEISNDKFIEICQMSRQNNGISRKDVEAQLKAVSNSVTPGNKEAQQINFEPEKINTHQQDKHKPDNQTIGDTEKADKTLNQNKVYENQNISNPDATNVIKTQNANVIVKYFDGREGVLILNRQAEHNDMAYVAFNDNEDTLVKFSDLELLSLRF